MIDTAKYKKKLVDRLAELEGRLTGIESELVEPAAADFEEHATEREGDEVLESLGNAGLVEIRAIREALKRIENGTYGICVVCNEDIAPERLDLVPHAPNCRNCA